MAQLGFEEPRQQLVGESPQLVKIRKQILRLARMDTPVFIAGESGTGKEAVARMIHQASPRAEKSFIVCDLAVGGGLHCTTLFGYARGAYTWARHARPGLLEEARGCTLFLANITELDEMAVPGLLRALREHVVCRIGDGRLIPIDVRVMAACLMEPGTPKADGWLRDLYRALGVERIYVPPLRERPDDVPPLAKFFLDLHAKAFAQYAQPVTRFSSDAMTALIRYPWPGNVRELSEVMERAVFVASPPTILCDDLRAFRSDGRLVACH
jgi:two-component system, NtrC family, response regulator AtoC